MNNRRKKNWTNIAIIMLLLAMALVIPVSAADAATVTGAATNPEGTIITIAFNKTMADPTGKQTQFIYKIGGGADQPFSAAALNADNTTINLTTSGTAIAHGNTVTVSYTAGDVVAGDGGFLEPFTSLTVLNNVPAAAPTVIGAATNTAGNVITITFNKAMANPAGKQAQFTYKVNNGPDQSFSVAALNADTTKIDLTTTVANIAYGNTVTVSYTLGTVLAGDSGVLATFTGQAVLNNVPAVAPVAAFTPSITSGTAPLAVTFTDHSTNTPTAWNWSFTNITPGNNTQIWFSTSQNPAHTFGVGNYSIVLNASNSAGYDISNQATFINVSAAVIAPVASFTPSVISGTAPLSVTFTDTSSNTPTAWNWSFRNVTGNNTQVWWSQVRNPPPMTFGVGNFSIVLNASNSAGYDLSNQVTFINVTPVAPVAGFSGTPVSGSKPLTVVFRDASNGVVTSYAWNFGDGNTSAIRNPSHVYSTVGTYYVNLTVTGPGGSDFENKTNYITVTNVTTKIGIYKDGVWNLDLYGNGGRGAVSDLYLAWDNAASDLPIAGDWNVDGRTETGVYRPGAGFYLKMDNGNTWNPSTDLYLAWDNAASDLPIAGDWNVDGRTETGVYRPGVGFYLKMDNGSTWNPSTDVYLAWDNAAVDRPIAGDWNMDGRTETGVYRPGVGFYLKMDNGSTWNPSTDLYLAWDNAAIDLPIAGDWNMDGRTETGVYRPGVGFYLKMDNGSTWNPSTGVNTAYTFPGVAGWPVVGDWNGTGTTKIGIYKEGDLWYLDWNGNGVWDAGPNEFFNINTGQNPKPVIGDWNGDGKTKVGSYSNGYWALDYSGGGVVYSAHYTTFSFLFDRYGFDTESIPVIGDWNGKGKSKVGVYRYLTGVWYLDYDGNGVWDGTADKEYNNIGLGTPVVGDWNGDGRSKIGVYTTNGDWYLDYDGNGVADKGYNIGLGEPRVGDWNGDGRSKIGVYNNLNGDWNLDYDGNGVWDATTDKVYNIGVGTPVVGKWS